MKCLEIRLDLRMLVPTFRAAVEVLQLVHRDRSGLISECKFYCKLLVKQREERAICQKRGILIKEFTTMGHQILSVSVERSDTTETFWIVIR